MDDIFTYLKNSFSERTDYLKLLVKMFEKIVCEENKHLNLFYLIVPTITINYVENTLMGKERLK